MRPFAWPTGTRKSPADRFNVSEDQVKLWLLNRSEIISAIGEEIEARQNDEYPEHATISLHRFVAWAVRAGWKIPDGLTVISSVPSPVPKRASKRSSIVDCNVALEDFHIALKAIEVSHYLRRISRIAVLERIQGAAG